MEQPLTQNIYKEGAPLDLKGYEKAGGYQGLRKALKEMAPEEVTETVKEANLNGRGGAGFSAGKKWSFVKMGKDAPSRKYLIVNADEMEPGTFKDRLLLEGDPHQLLEGMIISAYAIQADISYIFIRWAYKTSEGLLQQAINEAYEAGYLGKNILNSGYNLEMYIHGSVGRYMCGEETGLLNALEGKRATPRAKPPFPQAVGAFGSPTIVNNVETLCNVPHIINNGASWFKSLSNSDHEEGGTKIYGVSGRVNSPGAWELPLGTTMREIIEEHAGGMKEGLKFKGALPGGASTDFLVEKHMDIKLDYSSVMAAGSRFGTGTLVILDDQTSVAGFLHNLESFFAQESCGWCTPCRDGIPWTRNILEKIKNGEGQPGDIEILEEQTNYMGPGYTFCAFAPGAMEPLQSAIKYFREDLEKGINIKQPAY